MTALAQRQPREEDPAFLAYVRGLPCTVCRRPGPNDPAHIRSAAPHYGKRYTGKAEKPSDRWVLPLCRPHHDEQHRTNELSWWASKGIPDPFAVAEALYASRPGASKPRREPKRRDRPTPPRKPAGQRRKVPAGKPLESASNWPPKGRKFPSRHKEAQP